MAEVLVGPWCVDGAILAGPSLAIIVVCQGYRMPALASFLEEISGGLDTGSARLFANRWTPGFTPRGASLCVQGEPSLDEIAILDGLPVSQIGDADGGLVCTGLHVGPCVLTPNMARSAGGASLRLRRGPRRRRRRQAPGGRAV